MNSNKISSNGHIRKKYKRTKQRTGPVLFLTHYGFGRFIKCLIMLIGEKYICVGETYDRNFRATGLTAKGLRKELVKFLPWFPKLYHQLRGCCLTSSIVYNRWHKQHYNTQPGVGNSYTVGQSHEHARNDPKLIPMLEHVEVLFKRELPISRKEVEEVCALLDLPFGKINVN